jgi:predicted Rossmann fold nucleotide-binding protein DprA/Smf involved in DNA uptake
LNPREQGFLLLSSQLGDPQRKPLSTAQLRVLADRAWQLEMPEEDRDLEVRDLVSLGYAIPMAQRIIRLLDDTEPLHYYLRQGAKHGCFPITRVTSEYPLRLRRQLGLDSPGVLWAKGDVSLLTKPAIALVGSRELFPANHTFAAEVGRQAAQQGFVLVSGNARGADRTAQQACLDAGGQVISVVADALTDHHPNANILYLSEDSFDVAFSAQRALSRNRVIHALTDKVLVAQCSLRIGGTWDGTVKNLRFGWSDVFCFRDGSESSLLLEQMGANLIEPTLLADLGNLQTKTHSLF